MNDEDRKLVDEVRELLSKFRHESFVRYAEDLELTREHLLSLRIRLGKELALKREQYRMPNYRPDPKDKDTPRYTDFDRKTMLEAAVADLEADFELVKGLEWLVKERVEVLQWLS